VKVRAGGAANAKADAHRNGRGTQTAQMRRTNVQRVRADDRFMGSRSVGELTASGTSTGQALLHIPPDALSGSCYVVARTDWNGTVAEPRDEQRQVERIDQNWRRSRADVGRGFLPCDGRWPHHSHRTTKNQGLAAVGDSTTAFYLSIDIFYDETD